MSTMIHESIKKLLGEDLTKQVEEALKGKGKDGKDVDLVIGNDGSYVPADKYEALKSQSASAEKALKAAADALKTIGGSGDPAKIADDVKAAQDTIKNLQDNHAAEIKKIQKNTALRLALSGQAHDPADIISLLDLEKIEVDESGNLKSDLESLIKPIKETKPYLFREQEQAPEIKGAKPADPGAQPTPDAPAGPVIF
ncbi:phage scaffolding protein [Tepidanaerobacter syntrophicus]|jgi:hypothetical protein|uniref:phage scaffolding protein n=1 Tax=Tepidanaerobacter syntrophicus TaxID=224999 RepID=UPI001BD32B0D|nr:phage scaffolding protein [Tepidanaerobacter syntrophicus]